MIKDKIIGRLLLQEYINFAEAIVLNEEETVVFDNEDSCECDSELCPYTYRQEDDGCFVQQEQDRLDDDEDTDKTLVNYLQGIDENVEFIRGILTVTDNSGMYHAKTSEDELLSTPNTAKTAKLLLKTVAALEEAQGRVKELENEIGVLDSQVATFEKLREAFETEIAEFRTRNGALRAENALLLAQKAQSPYVSPFAQPYQPWTAPTNPWQSPLTYGNGTTCITTTFDGQNLEG